MKYSSHGWHSSLAVSAEAGIWYVVQETRHQVPLVYTHSLVVKTVKLCNCGPEMECYLEVADRSLPYGLSKEISLDDVQYSGPLEIG